MEKGGWIAVIVALITTAGVVASKYLEVSKPVIKPDPAPPVTPKDNPSPAPVDPAKPDPVKVDPVKVDPVTPEPKADPAPVEPPKPAVPRLSGDWVDNGGLAYRVEQTGATFRITASFGPNQVYAQGAILGRELRWSYTNNINNPGQCVGQLMPGDRLVNAQCQQANGPPYIMQLARAD